MSVLLSPSLPFPNIYWWSLVREHDEICLDAKEHFEKMTFRNRYIISGANGPLTLSIPLESGRQQRKPMDEIRICNKDRWQVQHWRTLVSAYSRSPFFEYYQHSLLPLFEQPFDKLIDFNAATMEWLLRALGFRKAIGATTAYIGQYEDGVKDIRAAFKANEYQSKMDNAREYYQVFATRTGFLPNLSMLDLLFAEGRNAGDFL